VDFLAVLIELFSLAVTAEALRAKTDWKLAFCCKGVGHYPPSYHVDQSFLHGQIGQWLPVNSVADTKKLCSRLFKQSAILV